LEISSVIYFFDSFFTTVVAFILCLSIIVFVHEFGHYYIGKLSGIHAEVFSVGFGPVLLSKCDKHGTKWQIAAFPLGGFVKFLGEGKLSSSKQSELNSKIDSDYKRQTMQGSPLWARFITVAAGPVFNFIFSGIIFFFIFLNQGTTQLPVTVANLFELPHNFALREGDVVLSINGVNISEEFENFSPSQTSVLSNSPAVYVIERAGDVLKLSGINQNPPRIFQVLPKSAAISAGLEAGDVILSINSEQVDNFSQIKAFVEGSEGKVLNVEYWRNGAVQYAKLTPLIVDVPDPEGGFERIFRIGIVGGLFPFEPVTKRQSFGEAIFNSVNSIYSIMAGSINGLYHILFGNISSCNLSGPLGIAETSGQMAKQGGLDYLWFIAVLSTAIGMINLFPIPVLDGGHLVFFTCEAVLGKQLNPKIINGFMTFGFLILIILMSFALFNDFFCP
tara:strand:+ start:243 stop:1583 length:1341 start_codon:yes stop_codon:yes gene_type:complete